MKCVIYSVGKSSDNLDDINTYNYCGCEKWNYITGFFILKLGQVCFGYESVIPNSTGL